MNPAKQVVFEAGEVVVEEVEEKDNRIPLTEEVVVVALRNRKHRQDRQCEQGLWFRNESIHTCMRVYSLRELPLRDHRWL